VSTLYSSGTNTGGFYQPPRPQLRPGQKVQGQSAYYCGSCKQTIIITATVVMVQGNKIGLTDMEIPDYCMRCRAPKPFFYAWEIHSNIPKPGHEVSG